MDQHGMQLLVAVDENWGIGFQDELLVRIKADLRRFKAMTTGRIVILGRRTLQTFPGGRPLPSRTNIILTRQADFQAEPALICHSLADLPRLMASLAPQSAQDCFVIGGTSVYHLLLPYCQTAHVTKIHAAYAADCHFPDLDRLAGWQLAESGPIEQEGAQVFQYLRYEQTGWRSLSAALSSQPDRPADAALAAEPAGLPVPVPGERPV